jgi:hypothetical protein
MNKSINEWMTEVHNLAKEKGWHSSPRSPLEIHMLVISEIAEATEAVRAGLPAICQEEICLNGPALNVPSDERWSRDLKPEGEAIELADAVIRIFDYFGSKGWDLEKAISLKHEFNKSRSYRHGGKLL